jgi:hypothetical protein
VCVISAPLISHCKLNCCIPGCVLHCNVSLLCAAHSSDPWNDAAGIHGRNQVLPHSKVGEAPHSPGMLCSCILTTIDP